jgi:hypothetical protein
MPSSAKNRYCQTRASPLRKLPAPPLSGTYPIAFDVEGFSELTNAAATPNPAAAFNATIF